jgi:hypothetical protein
LLAAFVVAFAGVATVADARTRHEHQSKPERFNGSCQFSGTVKFTPPMTTQPQPVVQHASAPGTCSGTFIDRYGRSHQLDGSAATYRAQSSGDSVSCAFGVASGAGVLVFRSGRIAFVMNEYRGGATPLIRLTGTDGGDAWMPVTPSQGSDPLAAVQACNGGGLDQFDLDAHMQTMGAISG